MKYKHFINDVQVNDVVYETIINKAIDLSVEFCIHTEHLLKNDYATVQLDIPMDGLLDMLVYDKRIVLNKANDNS